ncbi:MAG: hypothetical protein EPN21_05095 [Methylococcaceae bacterium]|nr:MAG: hypothetical protein EPN21_05095 [Methylococcaceae bacterium]
MAIYATLGDCADDLLTVTEAHLDGADGYVNGLLWSKNIDPAVVPAGSQALKDIAVAWARMLACNDGAIGEGELLVKRAAKYKEQVDTLSALVSRNSLGVPVNSGGGLGSISIGRS